MVRQGRLGPLHEGGRRRYRQRSRRRARRRCRSAVPLAGGDRGVASAVKGERRALRVRIALHHADQHDVVAAVIAMAAVTLEGGERADENRRAADAVSEALRPGGKFVGAGPGEVAGKRAVERAEYIDRVVLRVAKHRRAARVA